MSNILEMNNISKAFNGVRVLHNINFHLQAGTLHALCGENGAGKSTLMKILGGIYSKDEGEIILKGKNVLMHKPIDAIKNGIAMIHQELAPIKGMKVYENIFLGRELCKHGIVDSKRMEKVADDLLKEFHCNIKSNTIMGRLKVADMQLVEIAKAVFCDSDILIMDEPTSALTDREVKVLFEVIAKLKERGKGIIYISHKMDEVQKLSDEITVLRDGEYIGNWDANKVELEEILYSMVGRRLDVMYPPKENEIGNIIFEVKDLNKKGKYSDINFNVRQGEVLGIVGLVGAGRTEVMETLFGVNKKDGGKILYKGEPVSFSHPSKAIKKGIAFVTEDRKRYGLLLSQSIIYNISIASMDMITKFGIIDGNKEKTISQNMYDRLKIKANSPKQKVKELSGGNQQKIVLAKVLLRDPDLIILDEPTRGIDVGAKYEIYKIINEYCKLGKAIIFISSELPEVMGMSDRIVIFSNKTVVGELKKGEFDQTDILRLAMSNL